MNDERNRVQALVDAGRITRDEADILFAALDESGAQETRPPEPEQTADAQTVSQSADRPEPEAPLASVPPTPPAPADVQPPQPPEPPRRPDAATTETTATWTKLVGFCGDLTVTSDPNLSSPVVTGHATVERTDAGYLIRTPPDVRGDDGKGEGGRGIGNWLTRLHKAAGDVSVRLPADMGLELGVAAGDGDVRGVKALRGNFTGGDLDVLEAETVDLTVTAGDVTLKLRPRTGEGRLKATSGDVDVIFLAGSSAVVSGSATCGDLDLPSGFNRSGSFASHRFEGTLGAGEARLELRLTAGDVSVRAEDA